MGASGWQYFVPYDADTPRALQRLREQVFASGDFYSPTEQPASIEALREACAESGTHSVLDVDRVLDEPVPLPARRWRREILKSTGELPDREEFNRRRHDEVSRHGGVAPLSKGQLTATFGTERPDHGTVEKHAQDLFTLVARGCGVYLVVYDASGSAAELFFAGVTGD